MVVQSGTVAFWRDCFPGQDKFIYILGKFQDAEHREHVAFFTISSQTKWSSVASTKQEMVEIRPGTASFLPRLSYIQCWWDVHTATLTEFEALERQGFISYRGELPQFLTVVRAVVTQSQVLSGDHIDIALAALPSETIPATRHTVP